MFYRGSAQNTAHFKCHFFVCVRANSGGPFPRRSPFPRQLRYCTPPVGHIIVIILLAQTGIVAQLVLALKYPEIGSRDEARDGFVDRHPSPMWTRSSDLSKENLPEVIIDDVTSWQPVVPVHE